MSDLIDRQAAIDAVAEGLKHVFVENQDIAEKLIGKLPSAQPEQQWTPVEDALPIKSGVYLVCNAHGTVFTAMYLGSHWGTDGVIAWMETPEPYKEGDHEPN